jgi:hypothetical protein
LPMTDWHGRGLLLCTRLFPGGGLQALYTIGCKLSYWLF